MWKFFYLFYLFLFLISQTSKVEKYEKEKRKENLRPSFFLGLETSRGQFQRNIY